MSLYKKISRGKTESVLRQMSRGGKILALRIVK